MRIKVGVRIKRIEQPNGEEIFRASVPAKILFDKTFDGNTLQDELKKLEVEYSQLITHLRKIMDVIRMEKTPNKVLLYWDIGDRIYRYEKLNNRRKFKLESPTKHLIRDLGISKNLVRRCRLFRITYPDIRMIDPQRSWTSYLKTLEKGYKKTPEKSHSYG
jgi:hypothetical protein